MSMQANETNEVKQPTNGKKPNWTNWPSMFKAAHLLGLTVAQVRILVQTGDLPSFEGTDGTTRFDPEILRELRPEFQHLTAEDFDSSIATRKVEQEKLDAQAERQGIPVEAVRQQAEFNRTILNHNKELHQIVKDLIEDSRKTINASATVNDSVIKRQQEQLSHYHKMFDDMLRAREEQSAQQSERELLLMQERDKITRRQQVLGIAKDQVGKLVSIVAAKLGVSEALLANLASKFDANKLQAFASFFESLDSDQIDVAMASGFFTSEQVEHLAVITGRPAPGATAAPATAEAQPKESEQESCESQAVENQSPQPSTP